MHGLMIAASILSLSLDGGPIGVIEAGSNKPLPGASVRISRDGSILIQAETGDDGLADLAQLGRGTYRVHAEKPGYLDPLDLLGLGHRFVVSSTGMPRQQIALVRGAAIAGQVSDRNGQPVIGAKMIAVVRRRDHGRMRFLLAGEPVPTDDRGRYRLYNLLPGYYSVAVVPIGEATESEVFAPVYFPGVTDPEKAAFVELKPGETRTNVDLALSGLLSHSVTGTVSGIPESWEGKRVAVSLCTRGALRLPVATVLTDAKGSFVMRDLPPGDYLLTAWGPIIGSESGGPVAGGQARSAIRAVSIGGGGEERLDLQLHPLVTVEGRFVVPGSSPSGPVCTAANRISFQPEDGWLDVWKPGISVSGDRFVVRDMPAGRYRIELPALEAPCHLAEVHVGSSPTSAGSVMVDGTAPLTLVISAASGGLSGSVTTDSGQHATGVVILIHAEGEPGIQVARLDPEGRYRFDQVSPGPYRLVAPGELMSMDFLDPIAVEKMATMGVLVQAGRAMDANMRIPK